MEAVLRESGSRNQGEARRGAWPARVSKAADYSERTSHGLQPKAPIRKRANAASRMRRFTSQTNSATARNGRLHSIRRARP